MTEAGPFSDNRAKLKYTAQDFRFTTKGNSLYATALGWPGKDFTIESMDKLFDNEVESVELLGSNEKVEWKQTKDGLHISRPDNKPCDHAVSFKINRKENL